MKFRDRLESVAFALFPLVLILAAAMFFSSRAASPAWQHPPQAAPKEPAAEKTAPAGSTGKQPREPKAAKLDLSRAVGIQLPAAAQDGRAVSFKTADGREGWVVRVPGGRPIATPAYADGRIFVGGGYGSHEFYAFDADTGALVWKISTGDDGPTAAVVEDGKVVFSTESCTLIVTDAKTGKIVWQKWLGDPLMSQPAVYKGRVYVAFPGGQRGHRGKPGSHWLASLDLETGQQIWEQEISGDIISAPVVAGDKVHFTCFDGASYAVNASDGRVLWKKQNAGTSAPVIVAGQVVLTRKERKSGRDYEGLARLDDQGREKGNELVASGPAEYLGAGRGGGVGFGGQVAKSLDAAVGFGTAPPAAKLGQANANIGVTSVAGGWAYQGSRAAVKDGRMWNAQGRYLNSARAADGKLLWQLEAHGSGVKDGAQVFSPPALGRDYMYLSSSAGYLVSVRQKDGHTGFAYSLSKPMAFQPALARGNLYVGTNDGLVICLKTGNPDADGWYAWGGNAQHNR